MIAIRVLRQLGQHGLQRQLHIAKKPQLQAAAVAQRFGSQVDLRDVAVLRVELPIGEVGAEHQQRVAVFHRQVTRGKADQPGHADVIRVVVLDMLLAAQRMHDGCVQAFGQGEDFGVGIDATGAAQQGDFFAVIQKRRQLIDIAVAGAN